MSHRILLAIQLLISQHCHPRANNLDFDYTGPTSCASSQKISSSSSTSIIGYSSLITLNQDMYLDAIDVLEKGSQPQNEYPYTICPGSVFDITSASKESGIDETILIYMNHTILACHEATDETKDESCIIKGGHFQIVFLKNLMTTNVLVKGITFQQSGNYSIGAYSHPSSSASFVNCKWIDNVANTLVLMHFHPPEEAENSRKLLGSQSKNEEEIILDSKSNFYQNISSIVSTYVTRKARIYHRGLSNTTSLTPYYPSMSVIFESCSFLKNILSGLVLYNHGGHLTLSNSILERNIVNNSIVGIMKGGQLSIKRNTKINFNESPFVIVYVDKTSSLVLNENNAGGNNTGVACRSGIFLETNTSSCMTSKVCEGYCCPFGDDSCDRYIAPPFSYPNSTVEQQKGNEQDITTQDIISNTGADIVEQHKDEADLAEMENPNVVMISNNNTSDGAKQRRINGLTALVVLLSMTLMISATYYIIRKQRENAIVGNEPENAIEINESNNNYDKTKENDENKKAANCNQDEGAVIA